MGTVKVAQGNIEIIIYKKMRRRKNINSISATEQCNRRGYYYSTYRTAPSRQNNFFWALLSPAHNSAYSSLSFKFGIRNTDRPLSSF